MSRRLGVICGHLQASSSQQSALVAHPTAPPPIKNKPKPEGEHVRMFSSGQQMLFAKDTGAARARVDMKVDDIQVYTIPHIKEFIADLPAVPNTWQRTRISHMNRPAIQWQFISDQEVVLADLARTKSNSAAQAFIRAGVRKTIVWKPGEVKAAIVTCGGLCPGLNDVVQELVRVLYYNYGVEDIYGIRDGYRGFYDPAYETKSWKRLTPEDVEEVHRIGGTFLGSTRGGFQLNKIVDALVAHKVNHLYIVGGDGSHRAADDIFREVYRRKLKIVVATVPKTIDNDIGVIDRSFGFNTAIEEAQKAIISARIEASCTLNGIGIVKLMGRESGMIAAHATIASREVDICLIPEVPFEMDGPYGVLAHLDHVLATQGHAVIVVSEGAGEELCGKSAGTDPSGNKILPEIGPFLRDCIKKHFSKLKKEFSIKYHDPSYMIRSVPSTASDSIYCMTLAQNAVHGAMAGYTGFVSALVNNRTVYLPVGLITATSPVYLNPRGRTWERVLSSTHQPDFLPPDSDRHKSTKVVKLLYT